VILQGLRNTDGLIHVCLTRNPAHFPDCSGDPQAIRRTMPTGRAGQFLINDVPPGLWALSVVHDENSNGRLDTFLGIPREGFGFSHNPAIHFGAPSFEDVRFQLGEGRVNVVVRMKYML
jgi:uncharacterized protein (DUF2141 family)